MLEQAEARVDRSVFRAARLSGNRAATNDGGPSLQRFDTGNARRPEALAGHQPGLISP